jgi:hypothetical protein
MKTSRLSLLAAAALIVAGGAATFTYAAQGPGRVGGQRGPQGPNADATGQLGGGPGGAFGGGFGPGSQGQRPGGPGGPGGPGFGNGPGGPGGPGGPDLMRPFWNNEDLVAAAGITEDQIALLEASHAEARAALESAQGSVRTAHQAVREAMDVDAPNLDSVYAAIDGVAAAEANIKKIVAGHGVTVKTVLTEDQEAALRDYRQDRVPAAMQEARAAMEEFRALVKDLRADGSLSDADMATIDEAIKDLPQGLQQRIGRMRGQIQSNGLPDAPPDADAPGRPGRGAGPDARPGRGAGRLPALPES